MQGLVGMDGGCCEVKAPRMMTMTERLKNRKSDIEGQLSEINEALEALEKNPELQRIIDIVSKTRF